MSGITHLYELYNKRGKEFIDKLLNSYVTINEKMDGSAFIFERDPQTGKFNFYKRDQRNPITMVDRTLMKYYEKPIQYIESLPPHVLNEIPRGWRFGLEYFSSNSPVEIVYDRVPKNSLILSYVHKKDENGKIKGTIQDKEDLDTWADLLGVERAPIIFQGRLTEEQKFQILNFLRTPFEDLVTEYKTRSFVAFIIGVLNPELKTTALNIDLDKPIEGIVFRFGEQDSEEDIVLSKMVDPVFTELAKSKAKKKKDDKPSDFLGIAILDVMNFILERGVNSFEVEGDSEDKRYISFISDVFYKFLNEYSSKYKNTDFQEPEYLKRDEFRVNRDLIKDKKVLKYLDQDDSFESLYKLILNSFRKIKKRPSGIITQGIMDQFNSLVSAIEAKVSVKKKETVNESQSIPSFLDFKKNNIGKQKIEYVTTEDIKEADEPEKEDYFYSYNEFISALEKVDSSEKPKVASIKEDDQNKEQKLEDVNLIVGRFQPFHNGHLKAAKFLQEKNNLPCIIAVVHPGHEKSKNSPFSQDLVSRYMEGLVKENPNLIKGFFIVNRGLLGVIYGTAKQHGYLVKCIGAGEDRIADYKKQEEYLKKHGSDFPEDIKIIETPRSTSATEVREKLKNEDFLGFKKLVPSSTAAFYQQFVSALNDRDIKITESEIADEDSEIQDKNNQEEMKRISNFNEFKIMSRDGINESDGFGTSPFLLKKVSDIYHYFFSIEKEKGGESNGYHFVIGKYSDVEVIEGAKNSYCVLTLNQISHELIEDIAVDKEEIPGINDVKFEATGNDVARLMESCSRCLTNYLELNPKVNRIYDEIQQNLEFKGDGTYIEFMKSIVISYLGEKWSVQEGASKKSVLISR